MRRTTDYSDTVPSDSVAVPHSMIAPAVGFSPHWVFSLANCVIFKAFVSCFLPRIHKTASVFSPARIAMFVVPVNVSSLGNSIVAFHIVSAVFLISLVRFIRSCFVLSGFSISCISVPSTYWILSCAVCLSNGTLSNSSLLLCCFTSFMKSFTAGFIL